MPAGDYKSPPQLGIVGLLPEAKFNVAYGFDVYHGNNLA
jgi:hypothetical protein